MQSRTNPRSRNSRSQAEIAIRVAGRRRADRQRAGRETGTQDRCRCRGAARRLPRSCRNCGDGTDLRKGIFVRRLPTSISFASTAKAGRWGARMTEAGNLVASSLRGGNGRNAPKNPNRAGTKPRRTKDRDACCPSPAAPNSGRAARAPQTSAATALNVARKLRACVPPGPRGAENIGPVHQVKVP